MVMVIVIVIVIVIVVIINKVGDTMAKEFYSRIFY